MKRKHEDDLIKLAFGDLKPGENEAADRLLAEDAEAAAFMESFATLKQDLRRLSVPEHQLSTDRLREALLKDGLREKRPSTGWSWRWAFAPIAVAAGAFWFTMRTTNDPTSILNPPNLAIVEKPAPSIQDPAIDFSPTIREIEATPKSAPVTPVRPSRVTSEPYTSPRSSASSRDRGAESASSPVRSVRGALAARDVSPSPSTAFSSAPVPTPEELSSMAIDGALPAAATTLSADIGTEQPIVLIGTESDAMTGANRAMEVTSASNVLVGG